MAIAHQTMLYVEFPAQCEAVYVSLVVENPLTGTRCTVDAKVDTGSPYTILPAEVRTLLGLEELCPETLECVDGSLFETSVCMARIILDDSGDCLDFPAHIAESDITMPLLGMDILRKGDTVMVHVQDQEELLLRFTFELLPEDQRLLL